MRTINQWQLTAVKTQVNEVVSHITLKKKKHTLPFQNSHHSSLIKLCFQFSRPISPLFAFFTLFLRTHTYTLPLPCVYSSLPYCNHFHPYAVATSTTASPWCSCIRKVKHTQTHSHTRKQAQRVRNGLRNGELHLGYYVTMLLLLPRVSVLVWDMVAIRYCKEGEETRGDLYQMHYWEGWEEKKITTKK